MAKDLENLKELDRIKEEINETSMSEKEKRALEVFWDDNKRKNDFLISNYVYNTAKTPEEKEEAKKWHEEVNEALYGKPDEGTFYAILREKLESISPETEEEKAEQKALREEYLAEYRRMLRGQLDNTTVVRPDGSKESLKKKK